MDPKNHPLVRTIQDMYRMKVGSPQLPAPTQAKFRLPEPIGLTVVEKGGGSWSPLEWRTELIWPINTIFINTHLTIGSHQRSSDGATVRDYTFATSWLDAKFEVFAENEAAHCQLYDTEHQLYTPNLTGRYLFFGLADFVHSMAWGYLHPITD